jgi:V-type H+-transporting ATPase subunit a
MYKEVNPAIFAIVTFPYLFGVMFGDIGHGGLLLIASILMIVFNSKIKKTSMALFSQARYLLLMMGICAFYNGWIYNEFFAIPLGVFGSCYEEEPKALHNTTENPQYGYKKITDETGGCTYTMGMDPRWAQSDNFLSFTNNYKMKLAVVFAILQMGLGVIMKGFNNVYFKQTIDFFFEFLP